MTRSRNILPYPSPAKEGDEPPKKVPDGAPGVGIREDGMSADAHTHTLPTAPTQLTDRRAGEEIDPRWVTCPGCGKDGKTRQEINRCHNCGEWFAVDMEADG